MKNGFAHFALAYLTLITTQAQPRWSYPNCPDITAADFRKVNLVTRDPSATKTPNVTVTDNTITEPVRLSVAKDGRVFWVERGGKIKIWKPGPPATVLTAGSISVFSKHPISPGQNGEMGVHGIVLDPDFANNKWLYLHYAPLSGGDVWHVSRFTMSSSNPDQIDLGSEKVLITTPAQRRTCCHTGGAMMFDGKGDLWITMGNNTTNPSISAADGYVKEGDPDADDQGHAANTNDLRGKILRIHPTADGKYTIPPGNLFAPGRDSTRPEIYVMGLRNGYSIFVDRYTGWVTWGDIGPDNGWETEEYNLFTSPGNAGWPYFAGAVGNPHYSFRLNKDPEAPMNLSSNNKGIKKLPPARGAIFGYVQSAAVSGPIYYYDGSLESKVKLPPHFNKKWFLSDFSSNELKVAEVNANGTGIVGTPQLLNKDTRGPLHYEIGPDGALYIVEYGKQYFAGTADTKISRLEYTGTCFPSTPVPTSVWDEKLIRTGRLVADRNLLLHRDVEIPKGIKALKLFEINGKVVWEYKVTGIENGKVRIPDHVKSSGILKVKYMP